MLRSPRRNPCGLLCFAASEQDRPKRSCPVTFLDAMNRPRRIVGEHVLPKKPKPTLQRRGGSVKSARHEFKPKLVRYPKKTLKKNRSEPEAVSGQDRRVTTTSCTVM